MIYIYIYIYILLIDCVDLDYRGGQWDYPDGNMMSCRDFYEYPEACGRGDNENFIAEDLCCACKGTLVFFDNLK